MTSFDDIVCQLMSSRADLAGVSRIVVPTCRAPCRPVSDSLAPKMAPKIRPAVSHPSQPQRRSGRRSVRRTGSATRVNSPAAKSPCRALCVVPHRAVCRLWAVWAVCRLHSMGGWDRSSGGSKIAEVGSVTPDVRHAHRIAPPDGHSQRQRSGTTSPVVTAREFNPERRTSAGCGVHAALAVVRLNNRCNDRESESVTTC